MALTGTSAPDSGSEVPLALFGLVFLVSCVTCMSFAKCVNQEKQALLLRACSRAPKLWYIRFSPCIPATSGCSFHQTAELGGSASMHLRREASVCWWLARCCVSANYRQFCAAEACLDLPWALASAIMG